MSTYTWGASGARFVGDVEATYTEPADIPLNPVVRFEPDVKLDTIVFTVRRNDGATFELTAQRRDSEGYLMVWNKGTDEEFLMGELFRRANEHFEAERKAASA